MDVKNEVQGGSLSVHGHCGALAEPGLATRFCGALFNTPDSPISALTPLTLVSDRAEGRMY